MTKGELLDKLDEFESRVDEITGELEYIAEKCDTLCYDIQMLRRSVKKNDNER